MFSIKLIEVYCVFCETHAFMPFLKGIFTAFSIFAIFPVKYKLLSLFLFKVVAMKRIEIIDIHITTTDSSNEFTKTYH